MFIYVMDEKSKQVLEQQGYTLISSNGTVWCFENNNHKDKNTMEFSLDIPCVVSDVMMF